MASMNASYGAVQTSPIMDRTINEVADAAFGKLMEAVNKLDSVQRCTWQSKMTPGENNPCAPAPDMISKISQIELLAEEINAKAQWLQNNIGEPYNASCAPKAMGAATRQY